MDQVTYTVDEGDFAVSDGLSVFFRHYKPVEDSGLTPIVYLPGLMRTARDFDCMAGRFAGERSVITIDTRGRGRGGRAYDPAAYRLEKIVADVWALMDHLEIQRFVVIGVALGVFMAWSMAAQKPERIAGIVSNDTGTETVNEAGKRMISAASQDEFPLDVLVERLRGSIGRNFRDFGTDDWRAYIKLFHVESAPGLWKRDFDPAMLTAWAQVKEENPSFWKDYAALGNTPVGILRGEFSEYLTREQAEKMAAALPRARSYDIQGRAHPLLLDEPQSVIAIREILGQADQSA